MPVQAVVGLEGDQRLLALGVVEGGQEAVGGVGDALGGIDGLGAGGAERQKRRGGQHDPSRADGAGWSVRMPMV